MGLKSELAKETYRHLCLTAKRSGLVTTVVDAEVA